MVLVKKSWRVDPSLEIEIRCLLLLLQTDQLFVLQCLQGQRRLVCSLMQLCACLTLRKVHCRDTGGKNFKESRPLSTILLLARLFVISLKQVVICYQVKFCSDIRMLCMR